MYKVIYEEFRDLEDQNEHVYSKGDEFPYDKREISENRLEELSTNNNKIGVVLIELIENKSEDNDLSKKKSLELKEIANGLGVSFEPTVLKADLIELIKLEYEKIAKFEEIRKIAINLGIDLSENLTIEEIEKLIEIKNIENKE